MDDVEWVQAVSSDVRVGLLLPSDANVEEAALGAATFQLLRERKDWMVLRILGVLCSRVEILECSKDLEIRISTILKSMGRDRWNLYGLLNAEDLVVPWDGPRHFAAKEMTGQAFKQSCHMESRDPAVLLWIAGKSGEQGKVLRDLFDGRIVKGNVVDRLGVTFSQLQSKIIQRSKSHEHKDRIRSWLTSLK